MVKEVYKSVYRGEGRYVFVVPGYRYSRRVVAEPRLHEEVCMLQRVRRRLSEKERNQQGIRLSREVEPHAYVLQHSGRQEAIRVRRVQQQRKQVCEVKAAKAVLAVKQVYAREAYGVCQERRRK